MLDLTPRTIRYYDQMGLLKGIKRSTGSVRLFDNNDLETLQKIILLKNKNHSLSEIKSILHENATKSTHSLGILTLDLFCMRTQNMIHIIELKQKKSTPFELSWNKEKLQKTIKTIKKNQIDHVLFIDCKLLALGIFKELKTLCEMESITLTHIQLNSLSASGQLFVSNCFDFIQSNPSITGINRFIEKNRPLTYELYCLKSIAYLISGHKVEPVRHPYFNEHLFDSLFPIFDNRHGKIDLLDYAKNQDNFIQIFLEYYINEVSLRGNYIQSLSVIHNGLDDLASTFHKILCEQAPNKVVTINEGSHSLNHVLGDQYLLIGMD